MIVQDAIDLAMSRVAETGGGVTAPRSLMIHRISQMQQRLFALAARWNPDYFGTCVIGSLDDGRLDLADIIEPLEALDSITRVEVTDPGASGYTAKQEIAVVPHSDMQGEIAPRCTIRRRILEGVGTDLTLVTSVEVYYSPVPNAVSRRRSVRSALASWFSTVFFETRMTAAISA